MGSRIPMEVRNNKTAGVVVKALEGREEKQCLDLRRWYMYTSAPPSSRINSHTDEKTESLVV